MHLGWCLSSEFSQVHSDQSPRLHLRTVWRCPTIQYITIQHNTIQYNTIQYNTIQVLTVNVALEEDIRLCRIVNEDVAEVQDEREDENDDIMTNDESHHDVTRQSLPQRLKGVSLSGRRTARFILGKTNFLITLKTPFWYHQTRFQVSYWTVSREKAFCMEVTVTKEKDKRQLWSLR